MIPVGYMAKRIQEKPDWIGAPQVTDIYSVSGCISGNFTDYIHYWKHNGYWLFDAPTIIQGIAQENSISLDEVSLFYYEAYELEFDCGNWKPYAPERSFLTSVAEPSRRKLEGFDVVTFACRTSPECSPLSCNSLAKNLPVNAHCLLTNFEEAEAQLNRGAFANSEPGPYRIWAVYSTDWPESSASATKE
jgi:hypothetical protein